MRFQHETKGVARPKDGQRAPRIVIEAWGKRAAVIVEPRRVDMPSQAFRTKREARVYAEQLARFHGWPIEDRR